MTANLINLNIHSISSYKQQCKKNRENFVSFSGTTSTQSDKETNLLMSYLEVLSVQNGTKINKVDNLSSTKPVAWKNNLKTLFNENKAVIWAFNPRTLGAKDNDGDDLMTSKDEPGDFYNAVNKLDKLKYMGVNVLHVLPPHPTGKKGALSHIGSLYSTANFLDIDPLLGGKPAFKHFIDEAHKRGIHVMIDLPSCCAVDLFKSRPELMAFEQNGLAKTPKGWNDIRMFNPWADETKRILNPHLLQMHKDYVDMCLELGVDGIRADVARAKPTEFWDILIPYSHQKDPNFGWLGETYTYEDASPQTNMPYDRPIDSFRAGFDLIYGQWHIYHEFPNAKTVHDYVIDNLQISNQLPQGKSLIGSFATHDDVSPMFNGAEDYCMQTTVLQAFLPMMCPYFIDGFEIGDWFVYPYTKKPMYASLSTTDCPDMYVHAGKMDIFNLARPAKGDHPEIGEHMAGVMKMREKHIDTITRGSYIPLEVKDNSRDQIQAFVRHLNGKTLLVISNKDVNLRQEGFVEIPGLSKEQQLIDILPRYGDDSRLQVIENGIKVNLGKARAHVFEIDTPNIEISGLDVYRQNLGTVAGSNKHKPVHKKY